jgi:hypothetical protein
MVDLAFVPFLERMVSSMLYYKGFTIRGNGMFPGIDEWFRALEQRPSYLACRSDHYTHCHDLPPQLGGTCGSDRCLLQRKAPSQPAPRMTSVVPCSCMKYTLCRL